jgi:hypothetical protein
VYPVQKEKLGVRLLLVGELWFLFSLIWSPPLFQFIAMISFRWVQSSVLLWLFLLDFVLAGGLIISGLILLKASRRR